MVVVSAGRQLGGGLESWLLQMWLTDPFSAGRAAVVPGGATQSPPLIQRCPAALLALPKIHNFSRGEAAREMNHGTLLHLAVFCPSYH